jgi:Tfp pilus assembly protein PilV
VHRRHRSSRAGFTLAEAMIAVTIFIMVTLGVYTMLIKSYQMAALTRARDDARAVLRTYADQFERLQTTQSVGGATYNRWLFNPTSGPTGRGLQWGAMSDGNTSVNAVDVPSLSITLGGSQHAVAATLTRDVRYVDANDGSIAASRTIQAAGYMLVGTFAISYQLSGKSYSHSLTVVRVAP